MTSMRTIKRDIAGVIIISNDDKILLCKSYAGGAYADYWIIPGGGIEDGESELQAAIRETSEEVGIDISGFKIKQLDLVSHDKQKKVLRENDEEVIVDMTFYMFVVHADKPAHAMPTHCDDDIVSAVWHPISELAKLNIPPTTLDALRSIGL